MATGDAGTATGQQGSTEGNGATPPEGTQQQGQQDGQDGKQTGTEGTEGQQTGQEGTEGQGQDGKSTEGDLPEGAKKALDAARRDAREAKAEARKEREAREALEREKMSESERAIADARREGLTEGNKRLAKASVMELALKANFADADDAAVHLATKLTEYVDDDGEIDEKAITADLDDLANRKPHLLRTAQRQGSPRGGNDHTGGKTTDDPVSEFNALLRGS